MTQCDQGLAKFAEDASPRRHGEISPVNVKDTHLNEYQAVSGSDSVWRVLWLETSVSRMR